MIRMGHDSARAALIVALAHVHRSGVGSALGTSGRGFGLLPEVPFGS